MSAKDSTRKFQQKKGAGIKLKDINSLLNLTVNVFEASGLVLKLAKM